MQSEAKKPIANAKWNRSYKFPQSCPINHLLCRVYKPMRLYKQVCRWYQFRWITAPLDYWYVIYAHPVPFLRYENPVESSLCWVETHQALAAPQYDAALEGHMALHDLPTMAVEEVIEADPQMPAVEKRGIRAVVHYGIHGNAREIHGHVITLVLLFIEQTGSWKWKKVFQRQLKDGRWAKENLGFELLWSQSFTGTSPVRLDSSWVQFWIGHCWHGII